jgi:hypothetical protein
MRKNLTVGGVVAVTAIALFVCCSRTVEELAAPLTQSVAPVAIATIGGGNALTLPAQRHLLRMGSTLLLALQQDDGNQLGMFRSDDGSTFQRLGDLAQSSGDRDTADLLAVGNDVALVSSYEGPDLVGSTLHDVWFQWWRYNGVTWIAQTPVRVFDSTSSATGYYRAELAIDSKGRIWIQTFFLGANGSSSSPIAVSSDGGASFAPQPSLVTLGFRGGGRIASLGSRMLFVYDGHDDGTGVAHFRLRSDGDPLASWGPETLAFSDGEGIYHGAALSAVGDGAGGLHLFYKDKNMVLWYRLFSGASFGARQLVEDQGDWELQPASTRLGSDVVVFYNRVITTGTHDEVRARLLHGGVLGAPLVMDSSNGFKGYPASVDVLPTSVSSVPCVWGVTPDANSGGQAEIYRVDWSPTPPPPPDMATPRDLASPPVDLASSGGTIFSDSFSRSIPPDQGLGANWSIQAGAWYDDGRAVTDSSAGNRAVVPSVSCADCTVAASVITFGAGEAGPIGRVSASGWYELVLDASGNLILRRRAGATATILAQGASGLAALDEPAQLSLAMSGGSLIGSVGGVAKLHANDASPLPAGAPGLTAQKAGTPFDDFTVSGSAMPPPPPPPPPQFSDSFSRSIAPDGGLGNGWSILAGAWYDDGRAVTDASGLDLAAAPASCADCRAQASVKGFGVPSAGVFVRGAPNGDRYQAVLAGGSTLRLERVRSGVATVLAQTASGLADPSQASTITIAAHGAGPVALTVSMNGVQSLTFSDTSASALVGAGAGGLSTTSAGVVFDDFSLSP